MKYDPFTIKMKTQKCKKNLQCHLEFPLETVQEAGRHLDAGASWDYSGRAKGNTLHYIC